MEEFYVWGIEVRVHTGLDWTGFPVKHEKEEEALTISVVCAAVIIPPM